jgi:S-adenosylmethionine:tRNA ribosyltransferase-isomerase
VESSAVTPATWPRGDPRETRMLHVSIASDALVDRTIGELRLLLRRGDVLVVNDAATVPASLRGVTERGATLEARLFGAEENGTWSAVLFGDGDWRTRTEDRPPPPCLRTGSNVRFHDVVATIVTVDEQSPRLVSLRFEASGAALWRSLYRAGKPVQYAYAANDLASWHVQTVYATRPWAAEAPSAGFALTWDLLLDLERRGVALARVTHAAGLSSTGDVALDARLPLAERFDVPAETVRAIESGTDRGGRVVAVGTSVVRALEGAAARNDGRLVATSGTTDVHIGPSTPRRVVDGLLTGIHEPGTSHFALLESFVTRERLDRAHALAEERGYLCHEFGDDMLLL